MEAVTDFIFFGSKITVDSDYSHEITSHFLLGRKATPAIGDKGQAAVSLMPDADATGPGS